MRSQTYLSPQRLMRQLKPRWRRKTPPSHTWLRQKWPRRSPSVTNKQGSYCVEIDSGKVPRILLNRPAFLVDAADFTAVPHFLFDRSCGTYPMGGARRAVCTSARLCGDDRWRETAERFILSVGSVQPSSRIIMLLSFVDLSWSLCRFQNVINCDPSKSLTLHDQKHKQTAMYLFG